MVCFWKTNYLPISFRLPFSASSISFGLPFGSFDGFGSRARVGTLCLYVHPLLASCGKGKSGPLAAPLGSLVVNKPGCPEQVLLFEPGTHNISLSFEAPRNSSGDPFAAWPGGSPASARWGVGGGGWVGGWVGWEEGAMDFPQVRGPIS